MAVAPLSSVLASGEENEMRPPLSHPLAGGEKKERIMEEKDANEY
jgi:hypothetical protein